MAVTLDELLQQPWDGTFYLSRPLIPRGGRIVIGAPTKHFKSMLALNMAYQLAEGMPLLGVVKSNGDPVWTCIKPLCILYVEKEIGKYRLKERMEQIHKSLNGQIALDNLFIEAKGNEVILDQQSGVMALLNLLDKVQPDILVLDPLRKFHFADEDSSTEMFKVVHSLDEIQKKYKDLTTIILHHTGKRSDFRDQTKPESLRGSSILMDDADTLIMMSRPVKTQKEIIQLDFTLRSAEDPPPVVLKFDKDTFVFSPHRKDSDGNSSH